MSSYLFQGRIHFLPQKEERQRLDLVNVGLCVLEEEKDGWTWKLTEPFATEALKEVVLGMEETITDRIRDYFTDGFHSVIEALGPKTTARGFLAEPIELCPFSYIEYQNQLITETPLFQYIRKKYSSRRGRCSVSFPEWLSRTTFHAQLFPLEHKHEKEEKEDDIDRLTDPANYGKIIMPAKEMRPGIQSVFCSYGGYSNKTS